MGDSNAELIKAIVHYQQCLEKYTKRNDESRMLYCIGKLYKMPITVEHLEQTGVGRTVNSLRKFSGEVGDAAKSLVSKWKQMVMVVGEENEAKEAQAKAESSRNSQDETKDKKHREKSSSSSHKDSDKKTKYEDKNKTSSSYSNEDESLRKEAHGSKHKSHKKDKESKHHKHKSSKRSHSSERSDCEENNHERSHAKNHKHHKSSRSKIEDSDDESQSEIEKIRNERHKSSSSSSSNKRKHEDSDDEYDSEVHNKHKSYSENEESNESSEIEDKQEKISHKQHSKHRDEAHSSKEKSKHHHHKHKDKKEKKEYHSSDDKSKKHADNHKSKEKEKHSSSKEKIKSNSEKEEKSKKSNHSSKHRDREHKSSKRSSTQVAEDVPVDDEGICSGSGTSFAEALGMLTPSSKVNKKKIAVVQPLTNDKPSNSNGNSSTLDDIKPTDLLKQRKLEPLDLNISSLLPEITPNYRPLGSVQLENHHAKSNNKAISEEEALSAIIYSKISRTKVYSGNKVIWGKVPTLFELCTRVLQDNIDALEYTGGVPYSILKPVIERANPDQLYMLEHHNPYLIEETDELWQLHCQKEFRTKKRQEMETWRDMYMRCLDEREAKLKALTANIKQSQDKSIPVRQTKLAYVDGHSIVKPPRSVARKQAKHGTGGVDKKPAVTPSLRLSAIASAGNASQVSVPNPGARAASSTGNSSAAMKAKKAPLMQKTLALMKNRLFRR